MINLWYYFIMIKKTIHKDVLDNPESAKQDRSYWMSRPAHERVAAVDYLRRQLHGTTERLQRTARVIQQT